MFTTIIFLLVLTLLVFIHELGHFSAARYFKIRVDEFAIGFPPRIWSFMKNGTRFALNIIPLGGYVKIHGESESDELTSDSILSKPRWQQAIVLVAGVTFNIVLTWLLLSLSFMIGARSASEGFPVDKVSDKGIVVMYVAPNTPASEAGIHMGDEIISIKTSNTFLASSSLTVLAIQDTIRNSSGTIILEIQPTADKAGISQVATTTNLTIEPKEGVVPGKRAIGISMDEVGVVKLGFIDSFVYGAKSTWVMTQNIVTGLWSFFTGIFSSGGGAKEALQSVSGPVGIASIVGTSASQGFSALLVITAVISANLAVLNLAPFPALDGGRLVIVGIESIIRRRLNSKVVNWINVVGFFLLITLMIVVTFKDIWVMFK